MPKLRAVTKNRKISRIETDVKANENKKNNIITNTTCSFKKVSFLNFVKTYRKLISPISPHSFKKRKMDFKSQKGKNLLRCII